MTEPIPEAGDTGSKSWTVRLDRKWIAQYLGSKPISSHSLLTRGARMFEQEPEGSMSESPSRRKLAGPVLGGLFALGGSSMAVRLAAEQQQTEQMLYALAIHHNGGDLLGRALAEVTRRESVLTNRTAALRSVYDDIAAGRMT